MPILEFLGSVAAAVIGALVSGATRLFGQRWADGRKNSQALQAIPTQPSQTPLIAGSGSLPIQTLLIAGPGSLTRKDVVLTAQVRDMLRLSSSYTPAPSRPSLLAASSLDLTRLHVVTREDFVGQASDELITKLDSPVLCTNCQKKWRTGAYLDTRWMCVNCFYPYIRDLPSGNDRLFDDLRPLTAPTTFSGRGPGTAVQILQLEGQEAMEFIRRLGVDLRGLGIDLRRFGIDT